MIYFISVLLSVPIGFIIDNMLDKHFDKINRKKIEKIEKNISHCEHLLKKLKGEKDDN